MRLETDSLGSRSVPDNVYYGIHTARSLDNFDVAAEPLPLELIYAMVKLKAACARANAQLKLLAREKADAICDACEQILKGTWDDEFPIDVFQAGSGTSSNMNVNEVIANIAVENLGGRRGERALLHPNDDVNKGQSTNNVFPSAIKVAAVEQSQKMIDALDIFQQELRVKEEAFKNVRKAGRTHLQDAVPVTLGQEFGAYADAIKKDMERVQHERQALLELGIGGNAIGTGLNTKPEFRTLIISELNNATGELYSVAGNGLTATQFLTDLAQMSAALRCVALDLQKIVNDLRLLSSGPNTGFGDISLPAVEPGSSIMPGKINPSICEAANMACMQVLGCDHVIAMACGAGQLELNTHMPLIGYNLLKALQILQRCCLMLSLRCIRGIQAQEETCRRHFHRSAGLATVLNPKLGYDKVAELVKESLQTGKSLRELVLERELMPVEEFEQLLEHSTEPNL